MSKLNEDRVRTWFADLASLLDPSTADQAAMAYSDHLKAMRREAARFRFGRVARVVGADAAEELATEAIELLDELIDAADEEAAYRLTRIREELAPPDRSDEDEDEIWLS